MTNTTVAAIEQAAIPSVIVILQSLQTFMTNLGTDPAQVAAKFPGAVQVLIGQIELQAPALVVNEMATLQAAVNSKVASWISSLQAKQVAAPAAAAPSAPTVSGAAK